MLETLKKIGEWQREGLDLLDSKLLKYEPKSKNPLVLPIILNIDEEKIEFDENNIEEFDQEKSPKEIMLLKTFSARSHKTYLAIDAGRIHYLNGSIFGKKEGTLGDFVKHIDANFPELKETLFYRLLMKAHKISDGKELFSKEVLKSFSTSDSEIEVVFLKIIDSELGIETSKPLFEVEGFEEFVNKKYLTSDTRKGFCYVSNNALDDVTVMSVDNRKRILKMFQSTLLNYASNFNEKNLNKNFQLSNKVLENIKSGDYFIRKNLNVNIAGVQHFLIPEFPNWREVDIELTISKIGLEKDLLFGEKTLQKVFNDYSDWSEEIYWINFLAKYPDGNSFKTINLIKDVSEPYLRTVIQTFSNVDWAFRDLKDAVNWPDVMSGKKSEPYSFNFSTIYKIIPFKHDNKSRKPISNRNNCLEIFKQILEANKIEKEQLFSHFCELIKSYHYGTAEAKGYFNVRSYNKEKFKYATRDSVFKYLAFFQVLKILNLIDMKTEDSSTKETINFGDRINLFFTEMDFTDAQQALFYLGRMVNDIERLQKGKSKTVLDKLNYNGMGKDDIRRLSNALFEKRQQYRNSDSKKALGNFDFDHGYFNELFEYNSWEGKNITEQEALFFILSGYSYGIVKKQETENQSN
jgi:CRISPR-associated protein Csh1